MLNADAKVTVVSPRDGLNDEVAYRVDRGEVDFVDRKFEPSDLDNVDMVLTAVDDPEASTVIWKLCKERKIAANIADVPPECDFYFGSVHRDGPLQIMVSTNGNGPKLASIVRKKIAADLPDNIGTAIQKVGMLRRKLRKIAPGTGTEEGQKRMQWWGRPMISILLTLMINLGCQKFAKPGHWMILLTWMKPIWRRFLDTTSREMCPAWKPFVVVKLQESSLLTGALAGGDLLQLTVQNVQQQPQRHNVTALLEPIVG